jgi:hypothetical protein
MRLFKLRQQTGQSFGMYGGIGICCGSDPAVAPSLLIAAALRRRI